MQKAYEGKIKNLVKEMKDIPTDDIKSLQLAYKARKDVLRSVGLFPTQQYAHSLINIYNDNRFQTQNKIEPKVIRFIGQGITKNIQGVEEYEETS